MPIYNFKKEFAPLVESGMKRQTIRPARPRQTKAGETLYLYTGLRTKLCRKLREAVCRSVEPIIISGNTVTIDGRRLAEDEVTVLARQDGFNSRAEFFAFFHLFYGIHKELELIKW